MDTHPRAVCNELNNQRQFTKLANENSQKSLAYAFIVMLEIEINYTHLMTMKKFQSYKLLENSVAKTTIKYAPFRKISNSAQCGRFALILWRLVKGSFFCVF